MPDRVVVFDTSCVLCSRFINVLLRNDNGSLYYTGFDSVYANEKLPEAYLVQPETVVFLNNEKILTKSAAVLAILKYLGPTYRWLGVFRIVPQNLLNRIYDWVAKNRYGWFGRSEECYLPNSEQAKRFLD